MTKKIITIVSLFFLLFINILLDLNIKNYILLLEKCFSRIIVVDSNLYMFICLIIALISILIYLSIFFYISKRNIENKGKIVADDGTYGTSDWMNNKEIKNTFEFNSNNGILLGGLNGKRVSFDSPLYNKNVLVVGPSGSR